MLGLSSFVIVTIALTVQVQAHPADNEHKEMSQHRVNVLDNIDFEVLQERLSKSQPSLGQMVLGVKNTLFKIKNCNMQSKQELMKLANLQFNYQGCINATRDIANFEVFLLDTFHYVQFTTSNLLDVGKMVLQCHNETNIFDILKCVVETLQNSGDKFEEILAKLYDLLLELQVDTNSFITHVKACFGKNTVALEKAVHIIYNQC